MSNSIFLVILGHLKKEIDKFIQSEEIMMIFDEGLFWIHQFFELENNGKLILCLFTFIYFFRFNFFA